MLHHFTLNIGLTESQHTNNMQDYVSSAAVEFRPSHKCPVLTDYLVHSKGRSDRKHFLLLKTQTLNLVLNLFCSSCRVWSLLTTSSRPLCPRLTRSVWPHWAFTARSWRSLRPMASNYLESTLTPASPPRISLTNGKLWVKSNTTKSCRSIDNWYLIMIHEHLGGAVYSKCSKFLWKLLRQIEIAKNNLEHVTVKMTKHFVNVERQL